METLFDLPEKTQPAQTCTVLMSIVTKQAQKIMEGTKEYEFRKALPRVKEGDSTRVIVYSSQQDKAVIGQFMVGKILRCSLDDLMRETGYADDSKAYEWFSNYYNGREVCSALQATQVQRYEQPITLADIRAVDGNFRPPQLFMYLDAEGPTAPVYNLINSRVPQA